jgi:antigen flippase
MSPTLRPHVRRPVLDLALTILTSYGIQILGLATGLLLARVLGPEGRGVLASAVVWASIAVVVAAVGIPESLVYHIAQDARSARAWLRGGLGITMLAGIFATPLSAWAGYAFSPQGAKLPALVYAGFIPLSLASACLTAVVLGLRQYPRYNALRVLIQAVTAILLLALAGAGRLSPLTAVSAYIVAEGIQVLVTVWVVRTVPRCVTPPPELRKRLTRYGLRVNLGVLSGVAADRGQIVVLVALVSTTDLGLYVAALAFAGLVLVVGQAVNSIALAELSSSGRAFDSQVVLRLWRRTLLASSAVAAVVALAAGPVVAILLGKAYDASVPLLRLLLIVAVVNSGNRVFNASARAAGAPGRASINEIAGGVVGLMAMLSTVAIHGIQGAPVGLACGAAVTLLLYLLTLRQLQDHAKGSPSDQ